MMTQLFCGLLYLMLLVLSGVASDCNVEFSPPNLVVRYGGSALSTCRALETIQGMGWESTVGAVGLEEGVKELNWTVKELMVWTVSPLCFIITPDGEQCLKELPVVIYKMPDSVTLRTDYTKFLVKKNYTLSCSIEHVAPVQNLTVKWFRGEELLAEATNYGDIQTGGAYNKTFDLELQFSPQDDGKEYRCEAGLDFVAEPPIESQRHRIAVHYPPDHNDPEVEVVALDSSTKLNCAVSSNPLPVYAWTSSGTSKNLGNQPILSVTQAGDYTCTASNQIGSSSKHFRVESRSTGTFWTIIIIGAAVAVLLMVGYGIYKWKSGPNSII